ncbi:MAG: hypothetical protein AB1798_00130, partial [Spirochaetota bacterium]
MYFGTDYYLAALFNFFSDPLEIIWIDSRRDTEKASSREATAEMVGLIAIRIPSHICLGRVGLLPHKNIATTTSS